MASANRTCSVEGCAKKVKSRGWCSAHYERWRTGGDVYAGRPIESRSPAERICYADGCLEQVGSSGANGMCQRHYKRWRKTGNHVRVCDGCGIPLDGTPPGTIYCSDSCKPRCLVDGCDDPKGSAYGYCDRHRMAFDRHGCIPDMDFVCEVCGEKIVRTFVKGIKYMPHRKMCGQCQIERHRSHYRRSTPPEYLARRDGGDCGICGDPIDLGAEYPDPQSASIDHIVPVSLGGSDEETNLRLAHLVCNIRRGNRPESTEIVSA